MDNYPEPTRIKIEGLDKIPLFKYLKAPAFTKQELYERYPQGGEFGWYTYVDELKNFVCWDLDVLDWVEPYQGENSLLNFVRLYTFAAHVNSDTRHLTEIDRQKISSITAPIELSPRLDLDSNTTAATSKAVYNLNVRVSDLEDKQGEDVPQTDPTSWLYITHKPTTLAGYGITDGVSQQDLTTHIGDDKKHISELERTRINQLMSWFEYDIEYDAVRVKKSLYSVKSIASYVAVEIGGGGALPGTGTGISGIIDEEEGNALTSLLQEGDKLKVTRGSFSEVGHLHEIPDVSGLENTLANISGIVAEEPIEGELFSEAFLINNGATTASDLDGEFIAIEGGSFIHLVDPSKLRANTRYEVSVLAKQIAANTYNYTVKVLYDDATTPQELKQLSPSVFTPLSFITKEGLTVTAIQIINTEKIYSVSIERYGAAPEPQLYPLPIIDSVRSTLTNWAASANAVRLLSERIDLVDTRIDNLVIEGGSGEPGDLTGVELLINKQNSLDADSTNEKYPTVSAVIGGLSNKVDKKPGYSLMSDTEIARLALITDGSGGGEVSLEWSSILNRPTKLSHFTNDLGNYGSWATITDLSSHTGSGNNPHYVTKQQIELGNVLNAKQATKEEFDSFVAKFDSMFELDSGGRIKAKKSFYSQGSVAAYIAEPNELKIHIGDYRFAQDASGRLGIYKLTTQIAYIDTAGNYIKI